MNLSAFFRAQPQMVIFSGAMVMLLGVGIFDKITGWEISLFLFYAFPILFVAWFGSRILALGCALLCGLVWFFANLDAHTYGTLQAYIWAAINRQMYFFFVAIGGAAIRQQQEEMRGRLEAMTHARELEQEIVRISEREQMRIGQDLHDGLCQNLAAIQCATACMKADLDARSAPEASEADTIQQMLRDSLVEARNIARGIFPVQLETEGLHDALEDLVARTNALRHTSITFASQGEVKIADAHVAMNLYRIAQEALSNAVRHTSGEQIILRLDATDDHVLLSVEDGGQGFDQPKSAQPGMGLKTMQYRARLIGAELEIVRSSLRGTTVRCTLPLPV